MKGVTPGLRSQLITQRAQATPAERARHPRVVSLATVGTTPRFVVATATIEDGGIAAYRLRFTLQEQAGRWLVSSVQDGVSAVTVVTRRRGVRALWSWRRRSRCCSPAALRCSRS